MKKIFRIMPLICAALALTACKEEKPDPIDGGYWLNYHSSQQNHRTIDPVRMAFRLNLLLTEAALQGVEPTAANLMQEVAHSLVEPLFPRLFPNATLSVSGGTYKVTFNYIYNSPTMRPAGIVTFYTGGRLLQNLHEGGDWSVSLSGASEDESFVYVSWVNGSPFTIMVGVAEYYISSQSPDSWRIDVNKYISASSNTNMQILSDWTGTLYTVRTNVKESDADDYGLEHLSRSKFSRHGRLSGHTMFYRDRLEYTVPETDPLVYDLACANGTIASGVEKTRFLTSDHVDRELYPALEVEAHWRIGSYGECSSTMQIRYNGHVRDFNYY